MGLRILSTQEKLAVIDAMLAGSRGAMKGETEQTLKAIAHDLRARLNVPRSNALGQLERALRRMQESKTELGYDRNLMIEVAKVVINKWPFIRQAMEEFGEESAE